MAVIESSLENQNVVISIVNNDITVMIILDDCVFSFSFHTYAGLMHNEIICHI